jgi:Mg-chelatase subunit ChlD
MQLTSTMRAFWCVWDGVQQQVSFFGNEDVPLDVPRALDTSSSMHAVHLAVKSGARALLTKLREGDRALVVDVKQRVHVRAGLKAGLSHVVASINRLSTDGSTALCDGLYMSLQEFARTSAASRNPTSGTRRVFGRAR